MSKHIMLDLETLDTGYRACIVAIGACVLNTDKDEPGDYFSVEDPATWGDCIEDCLYARIDPVDACKRGLRIGADTVLWWLAQSDEARKALTEPGERHKLEDVLKHFTRFYRFAGTPLAPRYPGQEPFPNQFVQKDPLKPEPRLPLWGKGCRSDNEWLEDAYEAIGMTAPWTHKDDRCFRTLFEMYPEVEAPQPKVKHHALHDAIAQAIHLRRILIAAGRP